MYKTKQIRRTIHNFKKDFDINKKDATFINYGSFYRDNNKYINDIDIHCILNSNNITQKKEVVLDIIDKIENNNNILYKKYYTGHLQYYYRQKYTLKYFKKLNENGIISSKDMLKIEKIINNNGDNNIMKNILDDILELEWSYNDIKNGKRIQNINYDFLKCAKRDNFIWIDIVYKYKNKYLPIEFIIMTKKDFNKKNKKDNNIYRGCKLPLYEYSVNNYYNFVKRLMSCYCVNLKRKYYKNLSENDCDFLKLSIDEIKKFLERNYKYISIYHQKITKLKIKNNKSDIDKEKNEFNLYFYKYAKECYISGIRHNLLY